MNNRILRQTELVVLARLNNRTVSFFYDIHEVVRCADPMEVLTAHVGLEVDEYLVKYVENILFGGHPVSMDICDDDLTRILIT